MSTCIMGNLNKTVVSIININILVVISYYSFAECYRWKNLGKLCQRFLCSLS